MTGNYEDKLVYRVVIEQSDLDAITSSVASASARGVQQGTGAAPSTAGEQPSVGVSSRGAGRRSQEHAQAKETAQRVAQAVSGVGSESKAAPVSVRNQQDLIFTQALRSAMPHVFGYRTMGGHLLTMARRSGAVNQLTSKLFGQGGGPAGAAASSKFTSSIFGGTGATTAGTAGSSAIGAVGIGSAIAAAATSIAMLTASVSQANQGFSAIAKSLTAGNATQAIHGMISMAQSVPLAIGGAVAAIGAVLTVSLGPAGVVIGPIVAAAGALGGYIGKEVIGALHGFVDGMDSLVASLGRWSPMVAAQQALFEAKTTMFEIQMAQVYQPIMSAWIEIKSAVLDVLLDFGKNFAPLMQDFGDVMRDAIPLIKAALSSMVMVLTEVVAALTTMLAILVPTEANRKMAADARGAAINANNKAAGYWWSAATGQGSSSPFIAPTFLKATPVVPNVTGIGGYGHGTHFTGGPTMIAPRNQWGNLGTDRHGIPVNPGGSGISSGDHGDHKKEIAIPGMPAMASIADKNRITDWLDAETSKIVDEFRPEHESNRAACLSGLINPIGVYL